MDTQEEFAGPRTRIPGSFAEGVMGLLNEHVRAIPKDAFYCAVVLA